MVTCYHGCLRHNQNLPANLVCVNFSQTLRIFILFSLGCSSHLCLFGKLSMIKYAISNQGFAAW